MLCLKTFTETKLNDHLQNTVENQDVQSINIGDALQFPKFDNFSNNCFCPEHPIERLGMETTSGLIPIFHKAEVNGYPASTCDQHENPKFCFDQLVVFWFYFK